MDSAAVSTHAPDTNGKSSMPVRERAQGSSTRRRTWSAVVATTSYANSRGYGTSVLLPLTPANGYRPRVMIFGGGNPATATTEIIDLSAPPPRGSTVRRCLSPGLR